MADRWSAGGEPSSYGGPRVPFLQPVFSRPQTPGPEFAHRPPEFHGVDPRQRGIAGKQQMLQPIRQQMQPPPWYSSYQPNFPPPFFPQTQGGPPEPIFPPPLPPGLPFSPTVNYLLPAPLTSNLSPLGPTLPRQQLFFPPPGPILPNYPHGAEFSGPPTAVIPPPPQLQIPPVAPSSAEAEDPFLIEWTKEVVAAKKDRCQEHESLKAPEVRSILYRAGELLASLAERHQLLVSLSPGEEGRWREVMGEVCRAKVELQSIREQLEAGDTIERLCNRLSRQKKRKECRKQRRREREEEKQARRVQAEEAASSWLEKRREEELEKKTEQSVHAAASGLLGEVLRKQSDTQQLTKLANTLQNLREGRREASRKKGDAPPIEADEQFHSSLASLKELLVGQAKVYEGEEHALRVLMAEEVAEKMASSRAAGRRAEEGGTTEVVGEGPGSGDPLQPFREYYLQSERSVEGLVAIRREWDQFISPEGTPVPSGGLEAPPPSSTLWAHYCTSKQ